MWPQVPEGCRVAGRFDWLVEGSRWLLIVGGGGGVTETERNGWGKRGVERERGRQGGRVACLHVHMCMIDQTLWDPRDRSWGGRVGSKPRHPNHLQPALIWCGFIIRCFVRSIFLHLINPLSAWCSNRLVCLSWVSSAGAGKIGKATSLESFTFFKKRKKCFWVTTNFDTMANKATSSVEEGD